MDIAIALISIVKITYTKPSSSLLRHRHHLFNSHQFSSILCLTCTTRFGGMSFALPPPGSYPDRSKTMEEEESVSDLYPNHPISEVSSGL